MKRSHAAPETPTPLWQHPFVDVFKLCKLDSPEVDAQLTGDVTRVIDRTIGKQVFRLQGSVPAANSLQLPSRSKSLNLTGRYLYIQFHNEAQKYFTFHIFAATKEKLSIRLSFSNLYSKQEWLGRVIKFPCSWNNEKWTVLVLDLRDLLKAGNHDYSCLKSVQFCASLSVRGLWTSDNLYTHASLPRSIALPCAKTRQWTDVYHWEHLPKRDPNSVQESKPFKQTLTRKPRVKRVPKPPKLAQPKPSSLLKFQHVIARPDGPVQWLFNTSELVFQTENLLVASNSSTGQQRLLLRHSHCVSCFDVSQDGKLAAVGSKATGNVTIVNVSQQLPIAQLPELAKDVMCVHFSPDRKFLVAVGKDRSNRTQIVVWYIKKLLEKGPGSVKMYARQTSQFDIIKLKFLPFGHGQLVSCGERSIRFWRIKNNHLPGCSVMLGEYSTHTFTDVSSELPYGKVDQTSKRVFATTSDGKVFEVDFTTRHLECFYELHSGCINSIDVNQGFCVTGSEDAYVRVWPLDFSTFILESKMESEVQIVCLSPEGMQIAVQQANGSTGVLDMSEKSFRNVSRAHLGNITSLALHPTKNDIMTISDDQTVRLWNVLTFEETVEFHCSELQPLCCAFCPTHDIIAVGFEQGFVRVFDIDAAVLIVQYQQHTGRVLDVRFTNDGRFLFSSAIDGLFCVYDVKRNIQPMQVLSNDLEVGPRWVTFDIARDNTTFAATSCHLQSSRNSFISNSVTLYDLRTFRETGQLSIPHKMPPVPTPDTIAEPMTGGCFLRFCDRGAKLLLCLDSGMVLIYDVAAQALVRTCKIQAEGGRLGLTNFSVSPSSGQLFAMSGSGGLLNVGLVEAPGAPNVCSFLCREKPETATTVISASWNNDSTKVLCGWKGQILAFEYFGVDENVFKREESEAQSVPVAEAGVEEQCEPVGESEVDNKVLDVIFSKMLTPNVDPNYKPAPEMKDMVEKIFEEMQTQNVEKSFAIKSTGRPGPVTKTTRDQTTI